MSDVKDWSAMVGLQNIMIRELREENAALKARIAELNDYTNVSKYMSQAIAADKENAALRAENEKLKAALNNQGCTCSYRCAWCISQEALSRVEKIVSEK